MGLRLHELNEVGFAFNGDGTFDIFHRARSLSSGTYKISKDRGYLILKQGEYAEEYPLYSNGPNQLSFAYPFFIYTPKPLGERLVSFYLLNAVVQLTAPE